MNDTDRRAIEAMKAAIMPQLDQALLGWTKAINDTMATASDAEIDRCIYVVDICRKKAGASRDWVAAIDYAVQVLRDWKVEAAANRAGQSVSAEGKGASK